MSFEIAGKRGGSPETPEYTEIQLSGVLADEDTKYVREVFYNDKKMILKVLHAHATDQNSPEDEFRFQLKASRTSFPKTSGKLAPAPLFIMKFDNDARNLKTFLKSFPEGGTVSGRFIYAPKDVGDDGKICGPLQDNLSANEMEDREWEEEHTSTYQVAILMNKAEGTEIDKFLSDKPKEKAKILTALNAHSKALRDAGIRHNDLKLPFLGDNALHNMFVKKVKGQYAIQFIDFGMAEDLEEADESEDGSDDESEDGSDEE